MYLCTQFYSKMAESSKITAYKQRLRDRIVDTAMTAFAAHGIRAVKMDDIAQQLGISKRTLYELYENKEDLLYEGVRKYGALKEEQLRKVAEQSRSVMDVMLYSYRSKVEEFRMMSPLFFDDIVKYPKVMAFLEETKQKTRKNMILFLRRGVKEGYFRNDVDYDLLGGLFDSIGAYIMSNELYRQYTIEQLFQNLVFITLRGICTQRGVETLERSLGKLKIND